MKDPGKAQIANTEPGATDLAGTIKENFHPGTADPMGMTAERNQTMAMVNTVRMMDHIITTAATVIVPRKKR